MRMAVIKGGTVINIVEATADWVSPTETTAVQSDAASVGWTYTSTGFTPPPQVAPTVAQLVAEASRQQMVFLSAGQTFNVAASGSAISILCDGTNDTRASLSLLALYGQTNPTGLKTWIDNNGTVTVLSGAQLVTLATVAGNWITDTYAALASLMASINGSSPTVTTIAEINAFVWPTA